MKGVQPAGQEDQTMVLEGGLDRNDPVLSWQHLHKSVGLGASKE